MGSLVEDLYEIRQGEDIRARVIDGTVITGQSFRIDRDEGGVRVEICPYDGEKPQYRLQAPRTPNGWRNPYVERRPRDGEWERYGRLVDLE